MNKNKIISIILLFLVIILTLGIGLFFSYKSIKIIEGNRGRKPLRKPLRKPAPFKPAPFKPAPFIPAPPKPANTTPGRTTPGKPTDKSVVANPTPVKQKTFYYEINKTQQNIFSKNPLQYELDLNNLNDQLQNIYLFMTLFYTNQKNTNIYTELLKNNNSTWYEKFQNYGLIGNTENIDITQFLNPSCFFYYNTTNESINPSTIYYNIQNSTNFIKFINSLNSGLVKHSTNQLNYGTISSDYNTVPQYMELIEIMYVMTFVPPALYNIYIMPFNEIIVKFNGAIDTYEDYTQFQQLYSCANQMNLSKKNLSDNNGQILTSVNCIYPASPTENQIVQEFIKKLLPIFSNNNYILLLEPSYILFYESMIYFAQKFRIVGSYTDTYNYTDDTKINLQSIPPTIVPKTKLPRPTTKSLKASCSGTFNGKERPNSFNIIPISTFVPNNNDISVIGNAFVFNKVGTYLLTINFSQYMTYAGGGERCNLDICINMNTDTECISNIIASGFSEGNATAPRVENNIAFFHGKHSNNKYAYRNMFEYMCTITITESHINKSFFIYTRSTYSANIGEATFDLETYQKSTRYTPTFSIREITENS